MKNSHGNGKKEKEHCIRKLNTFDYAKLTFFNVNLVYLKKIQEVLKV